MKNIQAGFTLIELLVVIAVIAVLSGVVLVAIDPLEQINRVKDAQIRNDVGVVYKAGQAYVAANVGASDGQYAISEGPQGMDRLLSIGELKQAPAGISYYYGPGPWGSGVNWMQVNSVPLFSKQSKVAAAKAQTIGKAWNCPTSAGAVNNTIVFIRSDINEVYYYCW